jgi:hypothetical protein
LNHKFLFEFINGNRWQLEGKSEEELRFASLLNLQERNGREGIYFPYYPPKITPTYTFFDFTKDTLSYFNFLQNMASHELVTIGSRLNQAQASEISLPGNMSIISRVVTIRNEIDGGLLIHGILVLHPKGAIIIMGDTGAGKTTTARRLDGEKWKRLSDDRTLVVKDKKGNYYAYPWPGGKAYRQPELRYDISQAYPLKGMFIVVKNEKMALKKITGLNAVATLQHVVNQAMELPDPSVDPEGVGEMRKIRLKNISEIVKNIPMYELKVNLTDPLNDLMESVL